MPALFGAGYTLPLIDIRFGSADAAPDIFLYVGSIQCLNGQKFLKHFIVSDLSGPAVVVSADWQYRL
ncbi:hypothetical Protein YC6258_04471 [Gynuella sunshinyii YC6258]|uniref:Uncharacterized protein n=1 Tax=Gynuella sunshinyii YC6258 TaxID=1445510 RepID=A0A0C5VT45_9GAMM|nr:hypothetical Protein YC6258_04471 [Gynuella sunshinyii YC6258]